MGVDLHTENLKEYMVHAANISGFGELHDIKGNLLVYNGTPDSLFNWVFCKQDIKEETIIEILQLLKDKKWEITWAVDVHMANLQKLLQKYNVRQVSTPKKAFLNLANFYLPKDALDDSISLIKVENEEQLHTFDEYTSAIFFHNTGVVTKFLAGLVKVKQNALSSFLVKKNDDFVGTCTMYTQNGTSGFYADGVFPKYRNQKIGSQIVLKRIKLAKDMGCQNIIAHCMLASVNLYKRLGFRMLCKLKLYTS